MKPNGRAFSSPPTALRARDVADLTVAAGYPCITVLLPTTPAPRMISDDRDRLQRLVAQAEQHLRDRGVMNRQHLMDQLADQALQAAVRPTDRALAIYVSRAVTRCFRLPQAVTPRLVVESTFATRPLISALHHMPPHVLLVLHPTCAHLYAAVDGRIQPTRQIDPFETGVQIRLPGPEDADATDVRDEMTETYLRGADRMLAEYRSLHPSPLVLAGPQQLLDRFCALSRNLDRLAGRIDTLDTASALDLALASAKAVEAYLRTRRADALAQLNQALRDRPASVATGIASCWQAMLAKQPGMLLVEEDFISPGIPGQPPQPHQPGDSHRDARPNEVHDLVDDLMEQVIIRGGQLALVQGGDLAGHDRIALISRS